MEREFFFSVSSEHRHLHDYRLVFHIIEFPESLPFQQSQDHIRGVDVSGIKDEVEFKNLLHEFLELKRLRQRRRIFKRRFLVTRFSHSAHLVAFHFASETFSPKLIEQRAANPIFFTQSEFLVTKVHDLSSDKKLRVSFHDNVDRLFVLERH